MFLNARFYVNATFSTTGPRRGSTSPQGDIQETIADRVPVLSAVGPRHRPESTGVGGSDASRRSGRARTGIRTARAKDKRAWRWECGNPRRKLKMAHGRPKRYWTMVEVRKGQSFLRVQRGRSAVKASCAGPLRDFDLGSNARAGTQPPAQPAFDGRPTWQYTLRIVHRAVSQEPLTELMRVLPGRSHRAASSTDPRARCGWTGRSAPLMNERPSSIVTTSRPPETPHERPPLIPLEVRGPPRGRHGTLRSERGEVPSVSWPESRGG